MNLTMTAKELIEELGKIPPETRIVIRGYEDGFNDISQFRKVKIISNPEAQWYYGEYASSEEQGAIEAIELFGENKNSEI
jgi:hypothetical protein